jgi:4-amino-4-deoxy-L-arabinose transferase-like glycosyltransferase
LALKIGTQIGSQNSTQNQINIVQIAERTSIPLNISSVRFHLPALAALCALVFFYGLGSLPFLGPDEPRYAQVAREMYDSGDWITPRLAGIHWFEKPALTYWLAALGYTLFGVSEFAARVGIALLSSAGVFLLYVFGRRLHSAQFGYLSAAALATCGLWIGFARGATFDLPLSVCLEAALLCFFLWERQADRTKGSNALWWLFCLALGGAVLAKGLVGIVLPAAIIGLYLLLARRLLIVLQPRLLFFGVLFFLATAALWYGPMLWRHGQEFIDEFFIAHHFQRYTSNKFKHPQPFYFFFVVVLAGSFPWTPLWLLNLGHTWREWRSLLKDDTQRLRLFLWLWVLVPLAFFSFSGSKLPGYILPVFPALALLIGQQLLTLVTPKARSRVLYLVPVFFSLLGVAAYVAGARELGLSLFSIRLIAGVAMALAIIQVGFLWRGLTAAAVLFIPLSIALLSVVTLQQIAPALGRVESLAELSRFASQVAQPSERLVFYINAHHSVDFYAPQLPLRDDHSELVTAMSLRELDEQIRQHRGLLVLTPQRWSGDLFESTTLSVEQLGHSVGELRCTPGCDWLLLRARPKN